MVIKKGLGRGLGALIEDPGEPPGGGAPLEVPLEAIAANPWQPRASVKDRDLRGLADSIREKGVLEPLLVRRRDEDGYELIAGERRLRAARVAGLTHVPVLVREATRAEMLELALIENLHREDLNPIEEAEGYQRLSLEFERTQEQIAALVGKDRSTVANLLRLLSLPGPVQDDVRQGRLTAGHARALLALGDEDRILAAREQILARGLSVREAERLVRKALRPRSRKAGGDEVYYQALSERVTRALGFRTTISPRGRKGRVVISYTSIEELERLLGFFGVQGE
ncbi:MAG: ParB/RepB/Spo0J family partition protein [Thermodesulfobacteriota bacterium]